jgi:hypothetical protein|tara:strand:+ start:77 stop:382 length:306 start_codon:yes stop_codon:yes gene_type:complete
MKVGDIIVIDPYWRSRSEYAFSDFDPTWGHAGKKGIVIGFTTTWNGMNRVVLQLFDEKYYPSNWRRYHKYSPQHVRLVKEVSRYKIDKMHDIPEWVKYESW